MVCVCSPKNGSWYNRRFDFFHGQGSRSCEGVVDSLKLYFIIVYQPLNLGWGLTYTLQRQPTGGGAEPAASGPSNMRLRIQGRFVLSKAICCQAKSKDRIQVMYGAIHLEKCLFFFMVDSDIDHKNICHRHARKKQHPRGSERRQ